MAKSLEIPQDIIDNVIAAVGDDRDLLKQCALVSSSFLLPCRKQLFSKITLGCEQSCQGIHQVFVRNPVIQSFVRTITLNNLERINLESIDSNRQWGFRYPKFPNYKFPDWINGTSLLAILRLPFFRLECFSIYVCSSCESNESNDFCWDWNSFSSELKDALSNIIHLSTLENLSLANVTNVPITLFLHLRLTTLILSLSPNDLYDENSNSLAPMAYHTVIDRLVWHLDEDYLQLVQHDHDVHSTRLPSSAIFH